MRTIFLLLAWMPFMMANPTIVLTFDNLPIEDTVIMNAEKKTQKYLEALEKEKIQTVFFAIGSEIEEASPKKIECIKQLMKRHLIANHSFSHPHLSEMNVDEYIKDVMKCQNLITQFASYRCWFRYPFLDVGLNPLPGASVEKAKECAKKLKANGFQNGYVTIDSYDWFINSLLLKAYKEKKKVDQSKLEAFYVAHLKKTITRYLSAKSPEEKSLFKTHVFLFHANDLNALCLPKVISMLRQEGWCFASPDEAFNSKNELADFDPFITFKVLQLKMSGPMYLHNSEITTKEFQNQVIGE